MILFPTWPLDYREFHWQRWKLKYCLASSFQISSGGTWEMEDITGATAGVEVAWLEGEVRVQAILFFFFSFIFISWRLITSQHCSGFCHTLTWISHGVTCIPHPDPPSHLCLHPIPLGLSSAPGLSTCLMHPTWTGNLFHYR